MNMLETDICCPKFEPGPWDEKELTWPNKRFAMYRVISFYHMPLMPLNFGRVMKRVMSQID